MFLAKRLFLLTLLAIVVVSLQASADEPPPISLSGYVFGDFYWVAANHIDSLEGQNGFWIRRAYFTADKTLSDSFDVRFRLEMNSPGDFVTATKLTPFVKDAYIRWKKGNNKLVFGISPSPTWEFIENFWGYRSIEKTPMDLYRMGASREFGVAFLGGYDKVKFHLMVGNGAGESSEVNKGKIVLGSVLFNLTDSLLLELYADYNAMPLDVKRASYQGFLGLQKKFGKLGLQYVHQTVDGPAGDRNLDVFSAFVVYKMNDKVAFIGRFDRQFDPNPEGAKIPYIPFATNAKSNFVLAGLDVTVIKNVFFQPNVEFVSYDDPDTGEKPNSDVIPRITVFFKF
jgi:hypothetical protein